MSENTFDSAWQQRRRSPFFGFTQTSKQLKRHDATIIPRQKQGCLDECLDRWGSDGVSGGFVWVMQGRSRCRVFFRHLTRALPPTRLFSGKIHEVRVEKLSGLVGFGWLWWVCVSGQWVEDSATQLVNWGFLCTAKLARRPWWLIMLIQNVLSPISKVVWQSTACKFLGISQTRRLPWIWSFFVSHQGHTGLCFKPCWPLIRKQISPQNNPTAFPFKSHQFCWFALTVLKIKIIKTFLPTNQSMVGTITYVSQMF